MPRGNGTGPRGMGSGTGRGAGYCSGAGAPGFASAPGRRGACRQGVDPNASGGAGWGFGRSGAWGATEPVGARGANRWSNDDPETHRQGLRDLQATLAAINERLARLENAAGRD